MGCKLQCDYGLIEKQEPSAKRVTRGAEMKSPRDRERKRCWLFTHTLTFLSSYDISSHPQMIQLITGFIVSGPAQFINWLCTKHWLTLWLVLWKDVKHCRHSHLSETGRPRGKEMRERLSERGWRWLFWRSMSVGWVHTGACCVLDLYLCTCWMTLHIGNDGSS